MAMTTIIPTQFYHMNGLLWEGNMPCYVSYTAKLAVSLLREGNVPCYISYTAKLDVS